jgi:succinate-semialdehyde dehydrogenase/glutarate-semialdehyde dehydrogenase
MATSTKSRSGERGAPAKTSGDQPRPTAPTGASDIGHML